ncbi:MAG: response regulator [Deltaproteobacteria bacterium]|nr:response regulator [Deltaproteobacteria bacterium]
MDEKRLKILVVDDEAIVGKRLVVALRESYELETFVDPRLALARIGELEFDIVVTDVRMKEVDGMQILEAVRRRSPRTKVIIITAYATIEVAREAMAKGVFDFLAKPFKVSEFVGTIERAAAALRTESAAQASRT